MKLKPNKKNITLLIIMIVLSIIVINDFKMLILGYQFTWLGLVTNVIMLSIIITIYDYINEYITKKELQGHSNANKKPL
jgi:hypothetical protein|nr:MAG TPA: hypothetical protein [Bacteriophage sp.]